MSFLPQHRRLWITLGVIGLVLFLDQLTKMLARVYLQPVGSVALIGNFLRLTYVENPGMAFGIQFQNKVLFNILSIFAVLVIFYYLFRLRDHTPLRVAFAMILGGAFGNLIDRFFMGRVVDFIDVEFFDIHFKGGKFLFFHLPAYSMVRWPVFNLADAAVSIGMLVIIFSAFFEKRWQHAPVNDALPRKEL